MDSLKSINRLDAIKLFFCARKMPLKFFTALTFVLLCSSRVLAADIDAQQWRQVVSLKGIPSAGQMDIPSVYVFFDPNCPASAKLYSSVVGDGHFSKIDTVWIPVHYMSSTSIGKSAALLRTGKFSAVDKNFTSFDYVSKAGSIDAVSPTPEEIKVIAKAKNVWFNLTDTPATPMIVYKDRAGGAHVHLGYKQTAILEEIAKGAPSARLQNYDSNAVAPVK